MSGAQTQCSAASTTSDKKNTMDDLLGKFFPDTNLEHL